MSFQNCTSVTPICPVDATLYGYYPNFGANLTLLIVFTMLTVGQLILGLIFRVYGYTAVIAAGCFLETLGYAGRLMMNKNPWSDSGSRLQIITLIIAPTLTAAGIYMAFKHIVLQNGPEYSRLKPSLYTKVFIGCDVGSICLQAIGGGLAAAGGKSNNQRIGGDIIIAGIAFQVITMAICGLLAAECALRWFWARQINRGYMNTQERVKRAKARKFEGAIAFAYVTVLIRCIYRLPEMSGGWGNPRMRNEKDFLILDGFMIAIASFALTMFHPGYFYPTITPRQKEIEAIALQHQSLPI